jgi:hypothetical protein
MVKKYLNLLLIDTINFPNFLKHDFPILVFEFLKDNLFAPFNDEPFNHHSVRQIMPELSEERAVINDEGQRRLHGLACRQVRQLRNEPNDGKLDL